MENKICTKCNIEKHLSEFYFRKDTGKHKNSCIKCEKQRLKRYYSENTEARKESCSKYYNDNKEECNRKLKKFRKTENRKQNPIYKRI